MNKTKKAKIDSLWRTSDYGRWVACTAEGKTEEAKALQEKIFNSGYWGGLAQIDEEISEKILQEVSSRNEWKAYLKALSVEDLNLVEFMLAAGVFDYVFKAVI